MPGEAGLLVAPVSRGEFLLLWFGSGLLAEPLHMAWRRCAFGRIVPCSCAPFRCCGWPASENTPHASFLLHHVVVPSVLTLRVAVGEWAPLPLLRLVVHANLCGEIGENKTCCDGDKATNGHGATTTCTVPAQGKLPRRFICHNTTQLSLDHSSPFGKQQLQKTQSERQTRICMLDVIDVALEYPLLSRLCESGLVEPVAAVSTSTTLSQGEARCPVPKMGWRRCVGSTWHHAQHGLH